MQNKKIADLRISGILNLYLPRIFICYKYLYICNSLNKTHYDEKIFIFRHICLFITGLNL